MLNDFVENARSHGGHKGAWYREILPFRQRVGCGGGDRLAREASPGTGAMGVECPTIFEKSKVSCIDRMDRDVSS